MSRALQSRYRYVGRQWRDNTTQNKVFEDWYCMSADQGEYRLIQWLEWTMGNEKNSHNFRDTKMVPRACYA
jgi:hypothetical protein